LKARADPYVEMETLEEEIELEIHDESPDSEMKWMFWGEGLEKDEIEVDSKEEEEAPSCKRGIAESNLKQR